MKILGITAEYNPLHNGHLYQIDEAKKKTGADCTIIVMSGNFTQRGLPAIADKWIRARHIIDAGKHGGTGADIVVELPFAYACNTAKHFATGGVDTLVNMGADYISFGCETGNPSLLQELVGRLLDEEETLEEKTIEIMKQGFSRAKAYHMAVETVIGPELADLMTKPNNILAIEYLKRIDFWNKHGKRVQAVPVIRKGSSYEGAEDLRDGSGFAGAAHIRKMIAEGKDVRRFIPSEILFENQASVDYRMFMMLKAIIVRSTPGELADIYCVGEGLHNKLKQEINDCYTMDEYVSRLVSKRYTEATIRRIITYVLLGIKKEEMDGVIQAGIVFARVLASGIEGRNLIRKLKAEDFDIITNVNKEWPEQPEAQLSLDITIKSSDVFNMLCGKDMYTFSDRVFRPYVALT